MLKKHRNAMKWPLKKAPSI